jgi:hypothetical protein
MRSGVRLSLILSTVLTLAAVPARAADAAAGELGPHRVSDAHVTEALEAAGDNRAELERALAAAEDSGDAEERTSMRFLVANMPGKGYVVTHLADADGNVIPFDTMAYETFAESRAAIEALEKEHGELHWSRDRIVLDVETITSDFLVRHVELSLATWRAAPGHRRVGFDAFLNHVLPYRGSQEPLDPWLQPLRERYAEIPGDVGEDSGKLYKWVTEDVASRVRFDERFYLHPTDQGFSEMEASSLGRCEDITNAQTFAARALSLATAADYTPAWAHRDNNHAWNVLLDADGRGFTKAYDHAAKVYRKTYALQRGNLPYQLPEGREGPNRFLNSKSYVDVTTQYMPTTDVTVTLESEAVAGEGFVYICVFNGGEWTAIHWARIEDGRATFTAMGRNIVYLPAVHDGEALVPAAPPLLLHENGGVETLAGGTATSDLLATSVRPRQKSVDTHVETPVSYLEAGQEYVLQRWAGGDWTEVERFTAGEEPRRFTDLPSGALYWLVKAESRRLERVFTLQSGAQRWW